MPSATGSNAGAEWTNAALAEVNRLQQEYRDQQSESHRIVAGGIAAGTIALTLAQYISLDLALILSVVTASASVSWYMNINAEAIAIAVARDHLIERINLRNRAASPPSPSMASSYERVSYADLVGRAGVNAAGTTLMVSLMIVAYLAFLILGVYWSFDPPAGLSASRGLGSPGRQITQIVVTVLSVCAALTALAENVWYRHRVGQAIRADRYSNVAGTRLEQGSPKPGLVAALQEFTFQRGRTK